MKRVFLVLAILISSIGYAEVKSGQAVTAIFHTYASTGALTNADSLPTGAIYVDGTADAAVVTVSNLATGTYKAAVTCPTLTAGQFVQLRVAATISGVATAEVVMKDFADTKRVSEMAVAGDAMTLTAAYNAAKTAASTDDISGLSALIAQLPTSIWNHLASGCTYAGSVGKKLVTYLTTGKIGNI